MLMWLCLPQYIAIFKCETKGFWIKIKHCNATIRNLHFWKSRNLFDHPLFYDFSKWSVRRIIKGIKPVKHLNSIWSCINVHMSSATALFATLKCSAYQCNLRQDQHWVNRESGICYCDECQSAEHVTPAHNRTQYCLIVSCHPSPSSLSHKINAAWIVIIQTESRHVVLLVPRQSKAITWRVWDGDFRNITNDSRIQWKGGGWFCPPPSYYGFWLFSKIFTETYLW